MTLTEVQELVAAWTEKSGKKCGQEQLAEELSRDAASLCKAAGTGSDISTGIGNILWTLTETANISGLDLTSILADTVERKIG